MLVLGIETSCDETAVAVISGAGAAGRSAATILANRVQSQDDAHRPYGGVVPELAAREHSVKLPGIVEAALAEAAIELDQLDAVAATAGPGLIGGVMVGMVMGKALAIGADKPFIAVNHLEAHALSPRLVDPQLEFPYLLLLVSGGHCQLLRVEGVGAYHRLATTIDDAAGEAFDKVAKLLGLGFPGGPAIERLAQSGKPDSYAFPRPLLRSAEPHFSFAGLKTAVLRAVQEDGTARAADIAASFQRAVVDCLVDRSRRALVAAAPVRALVVAGGVAANGAIRAALAEVAAAAGVPFVAPPLWLCTDNGAMIAWAGIERLPLYGPDPLDFRARPRWPLDGEAPAVRGAGVKA